MKKIILHFVLLFLSCSNVSATKIARVTINELYNDAEIVAFVNVVSAITSNSDCGIVYEVEVIEPFKNTEINSRMKIYNIYNNPAGIRTGQKFIIFANKSNNRNCSETNLEVGHAGYAALWVGSPYLIDYDIAVKIPKSFIVPPLTLKTQNGRTSNEEISEIVWADKNKFIAYLRNISKN